MSWNKKAKCCLVRFQLGACTWVTQIFCCSGHVHEWLWKCHECWFWGWWISKFSNTESANNEEGLCLTKVYACPMTNLSPCYIYSRENPPWVRKRTHPRTFMKSRDTKSWRQFTCLLLGEEKNKMWWNHTIEYYTSIGTNETRCINSNVDLKHSTEWKM